ncbi:hypothetical protein WOC76_03350 [Methylocystis sp. IM3]
MNSHEIGRSGARLSKAVLVLPMALLRGFLQLPTMLVNLMEQHGTGK